MRIKGNQLMVEKKNSQKDPYRSPHEVTDSKPVAKNGGWVRWVVVTFVLLALGLSGLFVFSRPTSTFNMQRARPMKFDAPQAGESGNPLSTEGPAVLQGDLPPDTENMQNP